MSTSGLEQFFDNLRTNDEFLSYFTSEIKKINSEKEAEEPMEVINSPWLCSFDGGVQLPDEVYSPDYQSLPSPMDLSEIDLPIEDWPEPMNDDIICLGTFKNDEIFKPSDDSFNSLIKSIEEDVQKDMEKFTFSDIQPLKDKFRSALIQFTLFSANFLVCFACYNNLVAENDEKEPNLYCSTCDYFFPATKPIEEIKAELKQAVVEHTAICPELFLHFDNSDDALYVSCDGPKCTFRKYIDIN